MSGIPGLHPQDPTTSAPIVAAPICFQAAPGDRLENLLPHRGSPLYSFHNHALPLFVLCSTERLPASTTNGAAVDPEVLTLS